MIFLFEFSTGNIGVSIKGKELPEKPSNSGFEPSPDIKLYELNTYKSFVFLTF